MLDSSLTILTRYYPQGTATFTGERTVEVGGVEYEGEHVLIAVGGKPTIPDIPGAEMCDTSDEVS